jgi:hypothetical protein
MYDDDLINAFSYALRAKFKAETKKRNYVKYFLGIHPIRYDLTIVQKIEAYKLIDLFNNIEDICEITI